MKIALVAEYISRNNGGIFPVMSELAAEFTARGHEVCLFGAMDEYAEEDCGGRQINYRTAPVVWRRGIRYCPSLRQMLTAFAPDLIHIHGMWCYPEVAAASLGVPYLVSPHGMLDPWALRNSQLKKRLFAALFEHRVFAGARAIHALCASEAASIQNFHPGKSVATIPNGVAVPAEISPLPTADGKKQLLFLGRLHPKKGVENLLRAFLRLNHADWRLVIAGWDQNGYQNMLETIWRAAGSPECVVFAGPVFGEQKERMLRRSSAFILPSFSEGLPMAVLEAWSYRLPVLMTDFCNLPEGFAANAALRIEPDEELLTRQLGEFFAMSDGGLADLGGRGQALVRDRFTWQKVADSFLHWYDDAVKS